MKLSLYRTYSSMCASRTSAQTVVCLIELVCHDVLTLIAVKDWAKGRLHMQIWTGNEVSGGREQSDCERDLAPTHGMAVIRNPGSDYRLDTTPLYSRGAISPCRMDHRYSLLNNDVFCYGRRDKTAGKQRKKLDAPEQKVLAMEEADQDEEEDAETYAGSPVLGPSLPEQKRPVLSFAPAQEQEDAIEVGELALEPVLPDKRRARVRTSEYPLEPALAERHNTASEVEESLLEQTKADKRGATPEVVASLLEQVEAEKRSDNTQAKVPVAEPLVVGKREPVLGPSLPDGPLKMEKKNEAVSRASQPDGPVSVGKREAVSGPQLPDESILEPSLPQRRRPIIV